MTDDSKLLGPSDSVPEPTGTPETIQVGQWYWVQGKEECWLGCIVHIGSNYAKLEGIHGTCRVHFDEFYGCCERVPDPNPIIERHIQEHQQAVGKLLGRVKELTASLSITPNGLLNATSETKALALRGSGQDMNEYGKALVKAKEETLPELFREIKNHNEALAEWMSAKVIPLKAQAAGLTGIIKVIDDRIFNVKLYAGLVEQVERISDGDPAPLDTKVHLLQRRCYMDEECLARYETGGMEFADIHAFDKWLVRKDNVDRLLPFPRCIVAFKVRRKTKEREVVDLSSFLRVMNAERADKTTFMYIRNGQRIYRMCTEVQFGAKLFPDMERSRLTGHKLWAVMSGHSVEKLITDNEYQGMKEEKAREKKEWKERNAVYQKALKSPEAIERAKKAGRKKPDASCVDVPWPGSEPWCYDFNDYVAYNPESVFYDDITASIEEDIQEHNRIALIIQGLLDRSPVLHPHPPWQIWTDEGFHSALELVYDKDRALTAGPKVNFEEYRKKLNASLKAGCITVGQEDAWERHKAVKEANMRRSSRRNYGNYYPTHVRPYGNPGPGHLARVIEYGKRSGKCLYAWNRQRQTEPYNEPIRTTFSCSSKKIMNVDAYKPGDFRQFFDDPRTRAAYLKWAPFLLAAEEYYAGNRKIEEPPIATKKEPSWEGQLRYKRMKARKALLGKAVRLTRQVETRSGEVYEKGTLWRVGAGDRGTFAISGINEDGTLEKGSGRFVRNIESYEFEVDYAIPDEPKREVEQPEPPIQEDEDEESDAEEEEDEE